MPGPRCIFFVDPTGRTRWRLVAANGRALGGSPEGYPGLEPARRQLRQLAAHAAVWPVVVQHAASGDGWMWFIADRDGVVVAASIRPYERHATCWLSYRRFVRALANSAETAAPSGHRS